MRLPQDPRLPQLPAGQLDHFRRQVSDEFRRHATQVNLLSEGYLSAVTNAMPAAPTNGTWAQGDFIRNSAPTEQGSSGSKYVVFGFLCVAGGEPGTWVEMRFLTGN